MPHIHEKIDFVADVYIVNRGRVLLRKHDKLKIWCSPGGHIELHEDPPQAAVREAKEEVGLDIVLLREDWTRDFPDSKELIPPRFLNRHLVNETHEHISHIYFATSESDAFTQGETELSDAIRWFTREELSDPSWGILEHIRYYAESALDATEKKSHA